MEDRIDGRFEESVYLKCKICGCICSTKNINRIGARSIKPVWTSFEDHSVHYLALTMCNELGHTIKDLRLLTEEEILKYKNPEEVMKSNITLADRMVERLENTEIDYE